MSGSKSVVFDVVLKLTELASPKRLIKPHQHTRPQMEACEFLV